MHQRLSPGMYVRHHICQKHNATRVSGAKMLRIYRYAPTAVTGYVCRASYDVHRYRFDIQHQPPSLSQLQLCQHCVNVICYKGRRNVLLKWHFLCICPKLPTTSRTHNVQNRWRMGSCNLFSIFCCIYDPLKASGSSFQSRIGSRSNVWELGHGKTCVLLVGYRAVFIW